MSRLRSWAAKVLQALLGKLLSGYNSVEHKNRIEEVSKFFFEILPQIDTNFLDQAVIEGGVYNFFQVPSGGWSKFDLVVPERQLYVVVGGIGTASWDEARQRGVSRGEWELAQEDAHTYKLELDAFPVAPGTPKPFLLFISWGESVRGPALLTRLQSFIGVREGELNDK